ncbi:ATP-grasp domain-containing protein [Streptomyces sp. NPDC006514]|uniref:ATP-grasp domain-containing protein n=1 Tax=Streptomyces sp. NPDC006514 TaxID=3154308 RepID=UPI00339ED695
MTTAAAPRVAVVGGPFPLLHHARDLGVRVLLVQHPDRFDERHRQYADEVLLVDYARPDELLAALTPRHAADPFALVLSLTEPGLLPAAGAAAALGLPGNPVSCVRMLGDKSLMRAALDDAGLSPVAARVVRDAAGIAAFVRRYGPAVVKPVDGTGSLGVHRLDEPGAAAAVWERLAAAGHRQALAEEFLTGPEISVEAFSRHGRHTVLAVTDKTVQDNFVETGHLVPSRLSESLLAEVKALVPAFLDLVGLCEGPSHTEIKMTPTGPRIVESHPRFGGDKIRVLVDRVYGADLARLAVAVPLGLAPAPEAAPPNGAAAIVFHTPAPGVVRAVELPADPGPDVEIEVDVAVGDLVTPVAGSDDRAAHVLASGPDAESALARCRQVLAGVRIITEDQPDGRQNASACARTSRTY